MATLSPRAWATLPEGANIVHGDVAISTAGRQMTVNQSTRYGIVNWNSFSVGSGSSVRFNNGSGATLNRVTGLSASRIDGTVSATGSLFLLNRNGIILGSDGRILTGGDFVGSTRDMSDADFLDGGDFTLFGNSTAGLTNLGKITSTGGNILLAGYTVNNSGDLSAPAGRVGLAAGGRIDVLTDTSWLNGAYGVSLGERGNDITNEGRIQSLVAELRAHNGNIYALAGNNTGLIQATGVRNEGGRVILTADGGNIQSTGTITATRSDTAGTATGGDIELTAVSIENYGGNQDVSGATGGTIQLKADSITTDTEMLARGTSGTGGSIKLSATDEILFTAAGRIDASGTTTGGTVTLASGPGVNVLSGQVTATASFGLGGNVNLLGDHVSLFGATIDASGATGGGTIHVGGGYQGATVLPGVANASRTYVSDKTTLRADATGVHGDGGTVVAWADGTTEFAGTITARSGTRSGDGGTVETSGLAGLGVSGTVDASARGIGASGQWLLDPKNITIGTLTNSFSEFQSITQGVGSRTESRPSERFGTSVDLSRGIYAIGGRSGFAYVYDSSGIILARLGLNSGSLGANVQIEGDLIATGGTSGVHIFAKGSGWRNGQANLTDSRSNPGSEAFAQAHVRGSAFFLTTAANNQTYLAIGDFRYDSPGFNDNGAIWHTAVDSSGKMAGLTPFITTNPRSNRFLGTQLSVSAGVAYFTDDFRSRLVSLNLATGVSKENADILNGGGTASQFIVDNDILFYLRQSGGLADGRLEAVRLVDGLPYSGAGGMIISLPNEIITNFAVSGDYMAVATGSPTQDGSVTLYQAPGYWSGFGSFTNPTITQVFRQVSSPSNVQGSEERDGLGAALALDGETLLVGAPGLDSSSRNQGRIEDAGGVFIARRSGSSWSFPSTALRAAVVSESVFFGHRIAADGDTFLISDHGFGDQFTTLPSQRGRVYVYENNSFAAVLSGTASSEAYLAGFGERIAVSGSRIVASSNVDGSNGSGRVELFVRGSGWRNGTANRIDSFDLAGGIGSLALDGTTLAVGNPQISFFDRGAVHVFPNITSGLRNPAAAPITLHNPLGRAGVVDYFGNSIALSGNTLAVGQPPAPSSGTFVGEFNFETYSSVGLTDYNIFLFENLANNWATATSTRLSGATILDPAKDSVGWGYSLALDRDTLVTGYRRDAQANTSRGVYVFQRNGTWANSTVPVARLTGPARNFGFDVDIHRGIIAVSSPNVLEGYAYGPPSVTNDSPVFIFQQQSGWVSGTTNLIFSYQPFSDSTSRSFGNRIALNDNSLLVSTARSTLTSTSTLEPVFQFNGPFDPVARASFANNASGNLTITPSALTASLSLGTNVTLQANNDITISSAITVNNPAGDGGDLTLLAGRRILVNASIFTDNGDLTLIANAPGATAFYRDAGERVVVLGRDSANASVTLSLGTGSLVIAAADRFENRTGAVNPFRFATVNPGRWLVYSTTPVQTGAPDASNLLADLSTSGRDWVYYNRIFDPAAPIPADLPAGDGFIYSVQPTVGVTVGNASLTYGQAFTSATLSVGTLTVGGSAVSGTVIGIGSGDLANLVNVGLAGTVSINGANGFANAGTYVGGITAAAKSTVTSGAVYGVSVTTSGAGTLTVNKATLAVRPDAATRIYRDADPAFTAAYTGFVTGDSIGNLDRLPSFAASSGLASDVGTYLISGSGGLDNNYLFNFAGTGLLTITPRDLALTGLTGVNRVYNASNSAAFTGTPTIAPLGGDAVTVSGALTATASFTNPNVGAAKPLTFSGFGLAGAKAANYRLVLPTTVTATITPATLTLGGLGVVARDYDRTLAADLTGTATVTPLRLRQPHPHRHPFCQFPYRRRRRRQARHRHRPFPYRRRRL